MVRGGHSDFDHPCSRVSRGSRRIWMGVHSREPGKNFAFVDGIRVRFEIIIVKINVLVRVPKS